MSEKFLAMPKVARAIVTVLMWVVTVASFAGCILVKEIGTMLWLELVLTCVGMLFTVIAICLTIINLTGKNTQE